MFKTDNSLHVFVGRNHAGAYAKATDATGAAAGDVIIVDENGDDFGGAIVGDFRVGQKDASGSWRYSPLCKFANATITGAIPVLREQQVTTISAVSDVANTRYTLRLNFKNNVELFSKQSDLHFFEYVTGDTVTAGEVVDKFVAKIGNVDGALTGKVSVTKTSNTEFYITGLPQTWSLGLHTDTVVSFDATLDGFGAALSTLSTAPDPGKGNGRQVAELEWFGVGASGAPYRHGVSNNSDLITMYTDSTIEYGVVSLDVALANPNHAVAAGGSGRCQIVIALVTASTAASDANTALGVTWID